MRSKRIHPKRSVHSRKKVTRKNSKRVKSIKNKLRGGDSEHQWVNQLPYPAENDRDDHGDYEARYEARMKELLNITPNAAGERERYKGDKLAREAAREKAAVEKAAVEEAVVEEAAVEEAAVEEAAVEEDAEDAEDDEKEEEDEEAKKENRRSGYFVLDNIHVNRYDNIDEKYIVYNLTVTSRVKDNTNRKKDVMVVSKRWSDVVILDEKLKEQFTWWAEKKDTLPTKWKFWMGDATKWNRRVTELNDYFSKLIDMAKIKNENLHLSDAMQNFLSEQEPQGTKKKDDKQLQPQPASVMDLRGQLASDQLLMEQFEEGLKKVEEEEKKEAERVAKRKEEDRRAMIVRLARKEEEKKEAERVAKRKEEDRRTMLVRLAGIARERIAREEMDSKNPKPRFPRKVHFTA